MLQTAQFEDVVVIVVVVTVAVDEGVPMRSVTAVSGVGGGCVGVGGCAGCGVGGALPLALPLLLLPLPILLLPLLLLLLPVDMAGAVSVAAATAAVDVMHVTGDDVGATLVAVVVVIGVETGVIVSVTSADVTGGNGTSTAGGVGAAAGLPATDIGVAVDVTGAGGAEEAGGGDGGRGGVRVDSDLGGCAGAAVGIGMQVTGSVTCGMLSSMFGSLFSVPRAVVPWLRCSLVVTPAGSSGSGCARGGFRADRLCRGFLSSCL